MDYIDTIINAHTGVNSAGTTILGNKLLAADAQPAFAIQGDGDLLWGAGGASVLDTNLYRLSADLLNTDDSFRAAGDMYAVGMLHAESGITLDDVVITQTAANEISLSAGDTLKLSNAGLKFNDGTTQTTAAGAGFTMASGIINIFAGTAAPTGWLLCDGTSYATATYPNLFAEIGYTYGGAGANFNVPNLKGRVVVGIDSAQTEFDTEGETGGAKTHTLTTAELAVHSHGVTDPGHAHDIDVGGDVADPNGNPQGYANSAYTKANSAKSKVTGVTVNNAGSGNAHNNLQPYMALSYIIKT
jgi:microcystin-dependent protein